MHRFDKNNKKQLKDFLYNSFAHDAKIESVRYENGESGFIIEMLNPIFNVKMDLTFCNVVMVLAVRGNETGSRETVISLTLEEDFSCLKKYKESIEEPLYLLFQTFSGDELHILAEEIIVNCTRF